MGTSDEVAKAALFLACDDSSFITGIAVAGKRRTITLPSVRYAASTRVVITSADLVWTPLRSRCPRARARSGRLCL
ncbi:MAG: hypothetical protein WBW33_03195 [Bryobacteraceae bacterium]